MPSLLRACDVVVLNSGGLTFFEAHATGLPVLTYRCLAGHGRTNAQSLESAGLARWVHEPGQLAEALADVMVRPADASDEEVGSVCPSVAIGAVARQPGEVLTGGRGRLRRVRRLAAWVSVITAILWGMTNGTALAVSHGWREVGDETGGSAVYLVVDVSPNQTLTAQDLRSLAGLHAAVAVSVSMAARNPQRVRQLADAGLLLVNSAGGNPYKTGVFRGRGAIGAGARAIARITSHSPSLMLSDGDVDAVDVGLATLYGERIIVPKTTVACGSPGGVGLPRGGGVVLVRAAGPSCSLSATLAALSQSAMAANLHPTSLEDQVT
jgi:hypothetical protein